MIAGMPDEAAAEMRRSGKNPRMVAVALGTNGLCKQFGHPHIVGVTVMEVSRNASELADLIDALRGKRPLRLAGALDWVEKLELGVYGFHSIQQSIAPRLCSTMIEAHSRRDHALARELSDKLRRLNMIVHDPRYHYPRSLKAILSHLGFEMGSIRRPYLPPSPELQREMAQRLDELHLDLIENSPKVAV